MLTLDVGGSSYYSAVLRKFLRLGLVQEERMLLPVSDVCPRLGAMVALMTYFIDARGHLSMSMHL